VSCARSLVMFGELFGLHLGQKHPITRPVREEIDDGFKDMCTFLNREPDEIRRMCGGHSARLAELLVRLQRIEDLDRQWRPIRIREIDPPPTTSGHSSESTPTSSRS